MKYFYDTEFIDDGYTIELISIGVAAEDGREYYGISSEFNPERAGRWVRTNVLPKLPSPSSQLYRSRKQIRSDLEDFFGIDGDEPIELWAWVGAYDHVVLCQLWGPMTALPPAIPRFTRELRQFWEERGCPRMPPRPRDAHDALVDAKHNLLRYQLMTAPVSDQKKMLAFALVPLSHETVTGQSLNSGAAGTRFRSAVEFACSVKSRSKNSES